MSNSLKRNNLSFCILSFFVFVLLPLHKIYFIFCAKNINPPPPSRLIWSFETQAVYPNPSDTPPFHSHLWIYFQLIIYELGLCVSSLSQKEAKKFVRLERGLINCFLIYFYRNFGGNIRIWNFFGISVVWHDVEFCGVSKLWILKIFGIFQKSRYLGSC